MTATIDLYDPDAYVGGPPHEVLAELRRTQPVYFQEMADEPGYWAVLKHADVVHVARSRSCSRRARAASCSRTSTPEQLEHDAQHAARDGPAAPRRLPAPDRAALQGARRSRSMEDQIRGDLPRDHGRRAAEKGDVEFVHDVTSTLPSRVIGQLMGLPADDCR